MQKLDLSRQYKSYYTARPKPELVTLDAARFISITGQGDPSGDGFAANIQAMYATAYTIKFMCKDQGADFVVPKLEADWWYDEERYKDVTIETAPARIPRAEWYYRLMLRLPDFADAAHLALAIDTVVTKKGIALAKNIALHITPQQRVVQMMHIGPFDKEPETLLIMDAFMKQHNFGKDGHHHEVYLSDFRKTAPEKLKTILREPVA